MPELPEVQTTVDGINSEVKNLTITDVWTDYGSAFHKGKENIKNPKYFARFKKDIVGKKILSAERHGKNILIHLSDKKTVLIHMKMTGHLMHGSYVLSGKTWEPKTTRGPLRDPFNRHIHLVFSLSDKKHLAFSDLRKFAKVFLFDTDSRHTIQDLMYLGPDPLSKEFTFSLFKKQLLTKPNGKIKQVLMDQRVIAGIGNIYSDEALYAASVHPLSVVHKIPEINLKKIYIHSKVILKRGIDFGGDSDSDYRNIHGLPGTFQSKHNVYRRTGKPCLKKDGGTVRRIKVGGRSAHFCDVHQKLFS